VQPTDREAMADGTVRQSKLAELPMRDRAVLAGSEVGDQLIRVTLSTHIVLKVNRTGCSAPKRQWRVGVRT
jgi:hypothetical protein